jgi:death-on-curing protein
MEPAFLTLDEILEIHRDQITRYGGTTGIRDLGLLQSAAAMPAAAFEGRYLHGDLFEMAAAYLFHITCNHPFLDGNKRVGTVAAIVFLELNGLELEADVGGQQNSAGLVGMVEGYDRGLMVGNVGRADHARTGWVACCWRGIKVERNQQR